MSTTTITTLAYAPNPPLRIERDYDEQGHEFVVIEGVRYDADYFRMYACPETNVLYQVSRVEDFVCLRTIETREQAHEFFNEVERA